MRRTVTLAVKAIVAMATRTVVTGAELVPQDEPLLVVANHLSWADPPIFVGTFPRHIAFVAKEELWRNRFLAQLGRWHGDIRVRRGEADREAIRQIEASLKAGEAVAILPEGTRSRHGALIEAKSGAAFIAIRNNVRIQPAAIWGSERVQKPTDLLRRPKLNVAFGAPFLLDPSYRRNLDAATDRIMVEVAKLLPPGYHGYYADKLKEVHTL